MINSVSNPAEALNNANVDVGFIQKIKGYLNNPMYSFILPLIGIDKQTALQKLDSLEATMQGRQPQGFNEQSSSAFQSGVDELERYRNGIKSFK